MSDGCQYDIGPLIPLGGWFVRKTFLLVVSSIQHGNFCHTKNPLSSGSLSLSHTHTHTHTHMHAHVRVQILASLVLWRLVMNVYSHVKENAMQMSNMMPCKPLNIYLVSTFWESPTRRLCHTNVPLNWIMCWNPISSFKYRTILIYTE